MSVVCDELTRSYFEVRDRLSSNAQIIQQATNYDVYEQILFIIIILCVKDAILLNVFIQKRKKPRKETKQNSHCT